MGLKGRSGARRVRVAPRVRLRRRSGEESGQAMVEFALVLPVLLLVLLGLMQFGLLFFNYIDLTSAVRAGARKASVSRTQADPVQTTKDAIAEATSVIDDAENDVTVDAAPWSSGQDIEIHAEYPFSVSIMGVEFWSGPMTTTTVVRVE